MRRKKTRTLSPTPQAGEFLVWQSELVFSLDHKDHSHRLRFSTSLFLNFLSQFTFLLSAGQFRHLDQVGPTHSNSSTPTYFM